MVNVVNALIIRDKKLVVVRKEVDGKSSWIFPGGKPEGCEDYLCSLRREISEELPNLILDGDFLPYGHFTGISPNNHSVLNVYSYRFIGKSNYDLSVSTLPTERIKEARMEGYSGLLKLALSEVAKEVIQNLKMENRI